MYTFSLIITLFKKSMLKLLPNYNLKQKNEYLLPERNILYIFLKFIDILS